LSAGVGLSPQVERAAEVVIERILHTLLPVMTRRDQE
jgi:hypothetical protein